MLELGDKTRLRGGARRTGTNIVGGERVCVRAQSRVWPSLAGAPLMGAPARLNLNLRTNTSQYLLPNEIRGKGEAREGGREGELDGASESESLSQGHTVAHGPRPCLDLPGSESGGGRVFAGPILPYPSAYPFSFASGLAALSISRPRWRRCAGQQGPRAPRRRLRHRYESVRRHGPASGSRREPVQARPARAAGAPAVGFMIAGSGRWILSLRGAGGRRLSPV